MTNVRHIGYLTFHVAPLDAEDAPTSCTDPFCTEPASWREMVFHGEGTATGEPSADWGLYLYSNAHCDAHRFAVADIVQGALDADRAAAAPAPTDKITLVPIHEYVWTDDFSFHRVLTCKNHQEMRWSTKNPFMRSIFYISEELEMPECRCAIGDLMVIVELSGAPMR